MESETATKPRAKKTVKLNIPAAATADVAAHDAAAAEPAVEQPATEQPAIEPVLHAPQGAPTTEQPIANEDRPLNPDSIDKRETIDAPIAVPAVPAPLTDAQKAALAFAGEVRACYALHYGTRHQLGVAFVEPSKDDLKRMRNEYIEHFAIDPTDIDAVVDAAMQVKAQVDADRKAFEANASDQAKIDREWNRAFAHELASITAGIKALAGEAAPPATSTSTRTTSTPKEKKPRTVSNDKKSEWATRNKAMIAYCAEHGIAGPYLIDTADEGYEGEYHVLRMCADGRFEKIEYAPHVPAYKDRPSIPMELTSTGEYVDKPVYWLNKSGERPKYAPNQMFGILMVNDAGEPVVNDMNAMSRKTPKIYADYKIMMEAALAELDD